MSENGLITVRCEQPVRDTTDRLAEVVAAAGLTVFARIDHGGNAAAVEMELRPTELLIFGSPRGGTPLMQDQQTAGIDLPLKALVWEDADGQVWLTYNDAEWLAQRHGLGETSQSAVGAIAKGQAAVAGKACVVEPQADPAS
jgi:uncharacterized protein (DUF302 family)